MTSHTNTIRSCFLIALLLLLPTLAVAQDVVSVPDLGTMEPGTIQRVTVTGTIERPGVIEVTLDYPADLVRIRRIEGGAALAYTCPQAVIMADTVDATTGSITFRCDSTQAGTAINLFVLEVEALYGVAGTGTITPSRLRLDFVNQPDFVGTGGTVTVEGGDPLVQTKREGWTGNYPNPFSTRSRFVFTMREAGSVQLIIRNLQGRSIMELGTMQAAAGENEYELVIGLNDLAQGAYLMQLITERDSYIHPFMVLDP